MKTTSIFLACALLAVLSLPDARAEIRFTYGVHELETAEARDRLLERLARAARFACRKEPVLPPHYGKAKKHCSRAFIETVLAAIDDAALYRAAQAKLLLGRRV